MAFDESIRVRFGGDTSQLRQAVGQANALVDSFDKSVKKLGLDLGKGAGFGIFVGMLRRIGLEGIEAAQKTRDEFEKLQRPIDQATLHAARFGDELDRIKSVAIGGAQETISYLTRVGEKYAELLMFYAKLGGSDQFDNAERNRAIFQDAERNIRTIGAAREKTISAESQASERRAKAERAYAMESLSDAERRNVLMRENAELAETVRTTGEGSLRGDEARARLAENALEINRLDRKMAEDTARERERSQREDKRAAEEALKDHVHALELEEKQRDFKREGKTLQEQVKDLKSEEADLTEKLKNETLNVNEANEVTERLLYVQGELREKNKDLAEEEAKAQKKIAEQAAIAAELTERRAKISLDFMNSLFGFRDDRDFKSASDAELGELVRRSKQGLLNLQPNNPMAWESSDFDRVRLNRQLSLAQSELREREDFRKLVDMRGVEGARQAFQGDPLSFDRLLSQFTKGLDVSDRILRETEKTNALLAGKFVTQ